MNTETEDAKSEDDAKPEDDANSQDEASPQGDADSQTQESDGQVSSPEFQDLADSKDNARQSGDVNRFQNIKVTVSAELGRATIPIQTLMELCEGSVLELNREIDSPVELVAQGVALACGEVVVVNGCFAVRVTEVYETK
ncbi:MAG: FliM/FliN family flagellar motor switch protein [Mariniblastus sp.]